MGGPGYRPTLLLPSAAKLGNCVRQQCGRRKQPERSERRAAIGLEGFFAVRGVPCFRVPATTTEGKTRCPIGSLSRNWVTFIAVTAVNNSEDLEPTPLVSNIPCC